jgi:hypothetical protein
VLVLEVLSPKAEIRRKPELRSPKRPIARVRALLPGRTGGRPIPLSLAFQRSPRAGVLSGFGFRASFGVRLSGFGFGPNRDGGISKMRPHPASGRVRGPALDAFETSSSPLPITRSGEAGIANTLGVNPRRPGEPHGGACLCRDSPSGRRRSCHPARVQNCRAARGSARPSLPSSRDAESPATVW